MQLTLIRTGGIIPIIKKAMTEVDWSEKEMGELINLLSADETPGKMRDNTQYQIIYNDKTFSINLEKVPSKYKEVFNKLKDNLQIAKSR